MDAFTLTASDGHPVACYAWVPREPVALVQVAHGMGEHARRYDKVAKHLNERGYAVYANDHRGHGSTGPSNGYMGADGWNRCLADMYEINRLLKEKHPGLKLCLLGHSMGAMLSQQYITRYGESIDALILSGSPGFKKSRFTFINRWILKFEQWRHGADGASELMQSIIFGKANDPFDAPGATGLEWLSRDAGEVARYVEDDQCGFVLTPGSLIDMYQGVSIMQSSGAVQKIRASLPMYIFSGADDPVHGEGLDLERMVEAYRQRGMARLDCKLYPGGRHEMFNETNKDEVVRDLVNWLEGNLP